MPGYVEQALHKFQHPNPDATSACTIPVARTNIRRKSTTHGTTGQFTEKRNNMNATSVRNTVIPDESSQQHNHTSNQRTDVRTSTINRGNNRKYHPTDNLLCNAPIHNRVIRRKQHSPAHPLGCFLPLGTQHV
jgi:hypothetical protein